jgi:signal transduction histidine kinase
MATKVFDSKGGYYGLGAFLLTLAVVAASGLGPRMASTEHLLPHGFCYLWDPGLMRLHITSDALIGLAYIAIPISLLSFMRRRKDLPFNWMFLLFGVFIVACGATHLMELWTLWNPDTGSPGASRRSRRRLRFRPRSCFTSSCRRQLPCRARVSCKTPKIPWRRKSSSEAVELELRQAHALLAQRVQERTLDLQKANEQLEAQSTGLKESDRQKDEFLAILSHELRNPVHAIRMGVSLLKLSSTAPELQQTCSSLERQVVNISRLLNDLLSVLKDKRGENELKTRRTDIRDVIAAAVETASAQVVPRRQRLDVRLPERPVAVQADSGRLEQAITNLLTNASSYSDPDTAIDWKRRSSMAG